MTRDHWFEDLAEHPVDFIGGDRLQRHAAHQVDVAGVVQGVGDPVEAAVALEHELVDAHLVLVGLAADERLHPHRVLADGQQRVGGQPALTGQHVVAHRGHRFLDGLADLLGGGDDGLGQARDQVSAADLGVELLLERPGGPEGDLHLFGRALAERQAVLLLDVLDDRLVELVAADAHRLAGHDAAEGDHRHLGGAAADVDDHVARGFLHRQPGPDGDPTMVFPPAAFDRVFVSKNLTSHGPWQALSPQAIQKGTDTTNNLVIGRGHYFELTINGANGGLTGIAGGEPGRIIILKNVSGSLNSLPLIHNSSASTLGNRFINRAGTNVTVPIGGARVLLYSGELQGWVPIAEVP